jgi:hypothetical protein
MAENLTVTKGTMKKLVTFIWIISILIPLVSSCLIPFWYIDLQKFGTARIICIGVGLISLGIISLVMNIWVKTMKKDDQLTYKHIVKQSLLSLAYILWGISVFLKEKYSIIVGDTVIILFVLDVTIDLCLRTRLYYKSRAN